MTDHDPIATMHHIASDLEKAERRAVIFSFFSSWKAIQEEVKQVNQEHGWFDPDLHDAVRIALMHSELSEALEAMRHGDGVSEHIPLFSAVEEELADVIIRIMDIASLRGYRVDQAVIEKIAFNKTRPYKHGGKKF